jgi:tRNA pseudouridine55 synthase
MVGAKKLGHLGTLDPFASGVLLLGINEGTKVAGFFLEAQKSYAGVLRLGVETDTQDLTGRIVATRSVPVLGEKEIDELRIAFSGVLWQTPPMFSALRKNGERLYQLARRGESVSRPVRRIEIKRLRLWRASPMEIGFDVTCSKGTYLRTLATDMGRFLGCGAHLARLRRLACGSISLDYAVTLAEIEAVEDKRQLPVLSLNQALQDLRQVELERSQVARIRLGQQETLAFLDPPRGEEARVRLVDTAGELVAVAHWAPGEKLGWRLLRVFAPSAEH